MSFSWSNCTAIAVKSKDKSAKCFRVLGKYEYCLTSCVKDYLVKWLNMKINRFGSTRLNVDDIDADISELLRRCCRKDFVQLITRYDVESAEADIIMQIKNATDTFRYKGIYTDTRPKETVYEYNKRHSISAEDVTMYRKGVVFH